MLQIVIEALAARAASHPASTALAVQPASTGKIQALIPCFYRKNTGVNTP
jgi:hypothetical protein